MSIIAQNIIKKRQEKVGGQLNFSHWPARLEVAIPTPTENQDDLVRLWEINDETDASNLTILGLD